MTSSFREETHNQEKVISTINTAAAKETIRELSKDPLWGRFSMDGSDSAESLITDMVSLFMYNSHYDNTLPKAEMFPSRLSIQRQMKKTLGMRDEIAISRLYQDIYSKISLSFLEKQAEFTADEVTVRIKTVLSNTHKNPEDNVMKIVNAAGKFLELAAENARKAALIFYEQQKKSLDKITVDEEIKRLERMGAKLNLVQKVYMLSSAVDFSITSILRTAASWDVFDIKNNKSEEFANARSSLLYTIKQQLVGAYNKLKETYQKYREFPTDENLSKFNVSCEKFERRFGKTIYNRAVEMLKKDEPIEGVANDLVGYLVGLGHLLGGKMSGVVPKTKKTD